MVTTRGNRTLGQKRMDNLHIIARAVIMEEHKSQQMNAPEARMVTMVDVQSRTDRIAMRMAANGMARPDSYYHGTDNSGPTNGYLPNRARYPRTASEPHFNHGQGVYPLPGNQPSYETVATASGSSSEPAGYHTDPSSENSSVDRIAPLPVKEPGENYGFNGFGANPQYLPPGSGLREQQYGGNSPQNQGNGYGNQGPPPVPQKGSAVRVPIKLGKSNGNAGPPQNDPQKTAAGEKRKSWFGKRFSKG